MKRRGTIIISVTVFVVLAVGKWWLQSEPELEGTSAQEIQQEEKLSRLEKFKALFSQAAEETKGRFAKSFTKMGVRYLRERANETNQYRGTAGYVRERFAPSWNEQNFRRKRLEGVIRAQNNYFNTRLTQEGALKVGLVFSGGGYRAMILTTGYMQALSDLGLVDASMYISTLSGSTWFLAPWIFSGKSVSDFKQSLVDKINAGAFDLVAMSNAYGVSARRFANDILWPKYLFDQPIRSVDLYGALLANTLLADYGDNRYRMYLSSLWRKINQGQYPFPIFTAVSMSQDVEKQYSYDWYEFNPLEVINVDKGIAIDTFAFGRTCDKGRTLDFGPEQNLGQMLGIFGSAYTVNLKDLQAAFLKNLKEGDSGSKLEMLKNQTMAFIIKALAKEKTIGTKRIAPAQMNNPWRNIPELVGRNITENLKEREHITLVDAGIDFNVPLAPLWAQQRDVDVIIFADSSGGIKAGQKVQPSLAKAFKYAQKHGYSYQQYTRFDEVSNRTLGVFKDARNAQAPVIVYINYQRDDSLFEDITDDTARTLVQMHKLDSFDPIACVERDHCGTFNFKYTADQMLQLAAQGEFNIRANKDAVHTILHQLLQDKHERMGQQFVPTGAQLIEDYITTGF